MRVYARCVAGLEDVRIARMDGISIATLCSAHAAISVAGTPEFSRQVIPSGAGGRGGA